MVTKNKYFIPHIPPRLQLFFDENDTQIAEIFGIIKKYKPHIFNTYAFSDNYPPINKRYNFTEKLYIGCILYITKHGSNWESFIGPINGKLCNERHHQYLSYDVYKKYHKKVIDIYLKKNPTTMKYLSTDTTIINNKSCSELHNHLPYNKNRKGAKISTIVDSKGTPLILSIGESTRHDINFAIDNVSELAKNDILCNTLNNISGHTYFLGDSGYDGKKMHEATKKIKTTNIVQPNNRGTKNPKKIRKLNKRQKNIYKKRIKVEHFFGIIKKYPKINCVYEKKLSSFFGIVLLLSATIISKRNKMT